MLVSDEIRRSPYNTLEIPPLRLAEKLLQITREPKFHARFGLLSMSLKRGGQLLNLVGLHSSNSGMCCTRGEKGFQSTYY
jgi:hypothetical protein